MLLKLKSTNYVFNICSVFTCTYIQYALCVCACVCTCMYVSVCQGWSLGSRSRDDLETQIVNVSSRSRQLEQTSRLSLVSGYIFKRLGLVSVSLICKRSKPMSNFVQFVQKQTFYEHRSMPVHCLLYTKYREGNGQTLHAVLMINV